MRLLAAAEDETDLTSGAQARHLDRHQLTVGNLAERAASWQHRDSHAHFDRPLDAVKARQRDLDVDRRVSALVGAKHALPRRRGIVVRDDCLLPDFFDGRAASTRQWMAGMRQHDQLVAAKRDGLQATVRRLKRQDAKVQAPVQDLRSNGARPHPTNLHQRLRMRLGEPVEKRKERMDRCLVGADDDTPATDLLELADRDLGICGEAQQPRRVLLQQPSRFGQGAVADRAIEQPVAELFLEAPNRLADRGLGAVELLCGHREAALGGNGDKCAQILQLHEMDYNLELFKSNKYKLDSKPEPRLQT